MNQGIHLLWEKPTARGVRYYQVDLHQDLWGEWLLTQSWGRRGTRLGRVRVAPCSSHAEGLVQIAVIGKRRRHDPALPAKLDRRQRPSRRGFGAIQQRF